MGLPTLDQTYLLCISFLLQILFLVITRTKGYSILSLILKTSATLCCAIYAIIICSNVNNNLEQNYCMFIVAGLCLASLADFVIGSRHLPHNKNNICFYLGIASFCIAYICFLVPTTLNNPFWYCSFPIALIIVCFALTALYKKADLKKNKFFLFLSIGCFTFTFTLLFNSISIFVLALQNQTINFYKLCLVVGFGLLLLSDFCVVYNAFFSKLPKQLLIGASGLLMYNLSMILISISCNIYLY